MKSVSPPHVSPERAKHLERNRVAANKCRERKKREHKQIERRLSDETEKKEILLAQLNVLREEVWGLKNIIFQHAECEDHRINNQLAQMTQTALAGPVPDMVMSASPTSPTSPTQTWSDESVAGDHMNLTDPVASDPADWPLLPPKEMVFDPALTDSMFDNFIDPDNLYT